MFLAPCRPIYPDSPAGSAPPEKTQTTFKNRTSLYWASSLSSQHDATTTSICCWGQAYAGDIDQQLVCCAGARSYPSIYLRTVAQSTQQQTSRRPLLLSIDGTDRQTPDCYIDTAPHIMQAVIKMPLHWAYYYIQLFLLLLDWSVTGQIMSLFIPILRPCHPKVITFQRSNY